MSESIKSVFDDELSHLKYDNKFLKRVREYGDAFVNKNDDHVNFFGSNLLGVYPVRFRTSDKDEWFDDILEADDQSIRARIIALDTVDEGWIRGTDAMNLSCFYICHKISASSLPNRSKEQGMIDALLVLHFKLISSLMAHNFKYPADKDTAKAVYASLSQKFAIKQHGTWYKLLEARCHDIVDKKSPHYRTIQNFDNDADIQYMITDVQGRLRAIVKNLWKVFATIRDQDAKILSQRGIVDLDGDQVVRDMSRNFTPYRRYIHDVVQDKQRFIKPELVGVIAKAMHTMPEKLLNDALEYMSENYGRPGGKDIEEFIDETLLHAIDFLSKEQGTMRSSDLASIIFRLRAVYMSSRSKDTSLLKMRKLGEKIVRKAIRTRNSSTIAAVRTGVMLYLVARSFAMDHYQ